MSLGRVVKDIVSLRIQGAEAVGRSAVSAISDVVHSVRPEDKKKLVFALNDARKRLQAARLTEPYLRNSLASVFCGINFGRSAREIREEALGGVARTLKVMEEAEKSITSIGSKKIRSGMVVFTHCHSSTVSRILLEAKKRGMRFEVHNTETRPRMQGRKTAEELARAGIPVTHYVDSGARLALKKADIMMIGADAITSEGKVVNKIGSELFALAAQKMGVPVYSCANSWKFDPKTVFGFEEEIEERPPVEVWNKPPKGVKIDNHAFEIIAPELVSGVITELGVYPPQMLVEEIKRFYPWMI